MQFNPPAGLSRPVGGFFLLGSFHVVRAAGRFKLSLCAIRPGFSRKRPDLAVDSIREGFVRYDRDSAAEQFTQMLERPFFAARYFDL